MTSLQHPRRQDPQQFMVNKVDMPYAPVWHGGCVFFFGGWLDMSYV